MQNKQKLAQEQDLVTSLKMLATAYEEIAIMRMQRIRSLVLAARDFLSILSDVYFIVKGSYKKEIAKLVSLQKRQNDKTLEYSGLMKKNGKTVFVLLSANAKFYGDIIAKVFTLFIYKLFVENVRKQDFDIVIIGRLGRELFDQNYINRKYTYFEIPDQNATVDSLKPIVSFLIPYERIEVYYGKFVNLMNQFATVSSVSGDQPLGEKDTIPRREKQEFGFEPTLSDVVNFFETQGFGSLFTQTTRESELSRLASRITSMEEAIGNIGKVEGQLNSMVRRMRRLTENKKQQEALGRIYPLFT